MSEDQRKSSYAFGDSEAAARRLDLLAEVFAVPSRALLRTLGPDEIGLAVDLGCGPGHTTRLLAEELYPTRLAGLDSSEAFLAKARTSGVSADWYRHDVTVVPFPVGPADLIYARLVLAHLPQPEEVLERWLGQLASGGLLVVEEDQDIVTEVPVLAAYESMAAELVTARGGNLYIGSVLGELGWTGAETIVNRLIHHKVSPASAAQLFGLNFGVWRHDPHVRDSHDAEELDRIEGGLDDLAGRRSEKHPVDFVIRQIVLRKL